MGFGGGGGGTASIAGASDTTLNNPTNNEVLTYDGTTSMWQNAESQGGDIDLATPSTDGLLSAADKTKLNGVAAGATVNATNAQLRDRTTHTGVQPISSVDGLQTGLDGKVDKTTVVGFNAGTTLPASAPEGTVFFLYEAL